MKPEPKINNFDSETQFATNDNDFKIKFLYDAYDKFKLSQLELLK